MSAVLFLSFLVPPFQTPDEPNHFYRAEQVASGELIGKRLSEYASGGYVDANSVALATALETMPFNYGVKLDYKMQLSIKNLHWSGNFVQKNYPNTSIYPPFFYIPAAVAIAIGKGVDATIADTLVMARIFNGFLATACSALALSWCARGKFVLFTVLCLPMTWALFASSSQDALMLACAALLVASLSRSVDRHSTKTESIAIVCFIALLAMSRVAYIGFIPLLFLRSLEWRRRLILIAACSAVCLLWYFLLEHWVRVPMDAIAPADRHISVTGQIAYLLESPERILKIGFETIKMFGTRYLHLFIGQLGWVDTPMPTFFYYAASSIMVVALLSELSSDPDFSNSGKLIVIFSIFASSACVFGALYVTWNDVGSPVVRGVQGRYFIPIAMLSGFLIPKSSIIRNSCNRILDLLVLTFPIYSILNVYFVVLDRFYPITE